MKHSSRAGVKWAGKHVPAHSTATLGARGKHRLVNQFPGSSGVKKAGGSYPNTRNPQRKSSMFSCHTRPSFTFHDRVSQVCLSDGHPGEGEGVPVPAETHSSLKQDEAGNAVATVAASLISAPQGKAYIL